MSSQDTRLESLIASGATVKTFTRKDLSRVTIKLLDGHEYSATGHSLDIAMDRTLSKIDSRKEDIKRNRRRKQREREEIMEYVYGGEEEVNN